MSIARAGEVLMGTLRWEKESEETAKQARHRAEFNHKRRELQFVEANTSARSKLCSGSATATR